MSLPSTWRHFQLFDFLPIRDPYYQSPSPLYSDPLLSSICNTQSYITFAVQNCDVVLLSKKLLEKIGRFCAYDAEYRISFLRALPHSNLLVTLAEKQGSPAHLKVWDLNKMVLLTLPETGAEEITKHKYVTNVQISDGPNAYPISCFTFNESLTCIAIGYTSGKVILVRGDLLRDRGLKQRIIYEGAEPITGIHYNRFEQILYVTTTSKVITLLTTGRNQGKPLRILSNKNGVDLDCSDVEPRSAKLIVADADGFRFYNHVSKAHVINFNMPKRKILRLFRDYLLVISPMEDSTSAKSSLTRLLVLDMHNMQISFSLTIPNLTISHVFYSNAEGEAYLLSTDGVLYKLHEKAMNQQIEIILQRRLFPIALSMARQYNLSSEMLYRINLLNADTLYEKQDYDGAIDKYIECLSLLQDIQNSATKSSDSVGNIDDFIIGVITNFKGVSNIHNMAKFLAKLYELNLSDSDHITLLLCCYCKLRMTEELDTFIAGIDLMEDRVISSNKLDLSKLKFSLIINLFKECGYYAQVTKLLYKLNHPHLIVEIQLQDLRQYENCMSYIRSLPINELLRILIDYLKNLLDIMPIETTELLIDVFTGKYKPNPSHLLFEAAIPSTNNTHPQVNPAPEANISSYSAFLSYLAGPLRQGTEKDAENVEEVVSMDPTYLPPKPSLVFPCFIGHPKEFIVFLEACAESFEKYQGNNSQKQEIIMTLFELYVSMTVEDQASSDNWKSKATSILKNQSQILDKPRILLLSHIYDFQVESFLSLDAENLEESQFRSAQLKNNVVDALAIVKSSGEKHPHLYKLMLKMLLASKENFNSISQKEKQYLIKNISKHNLASPLELLGMLSIYESAPIGLVKDLIIEHVGRLNREISNNLKLVESYETESTKNSFKLTELTTKPTILKSNKCSSCELKLDFPAIYFKCLHSYHSRCLNENTYIPEPIEERQLCPLCINDVIEAKSVREKQLHSSNDYDVFMSQLNESSDRFKIITEYFGRGIMEDEIPAFD